MTFDPVPACFTGVGFLPIPRLERVVAARLRKLEETTGKKPTLPIDIEALVEIVEQIEVSYFGDESEFGADVLGAYDFSQKRMFIRESIDNPGRRRFTWAHEYGHVVLHGPYYLQQVFDFFDAGEDGRMQLHRGLASTRNKLEWQANLFAGHILMPTHLVRYALGGNASGVENLVDELAERAEVSRQAARIRLEQLGLISN